VAPLLGLQGSIFLAPRLRAFGQAWNNGATPDNGYNSYQYGPEVSVKFFF
jgi:hypothetical protein